MTAGPGREQPAAVGGDASVLIDRALNRALRAMHRRGGMTCKEIGKQFGSRYREWARQIGVPHLPNRAMLQAQQLGLAEPRLETRATRGSGGQTVPREVDVWYLTALGERRAQASLWTDPTARRGEARRRERADAAHRRQTGQTAGAAGG